MNGDTKSYDDLRCEIGDLRLKLGEMRQLVAEANQERQDLLLEIVGMMADKLVNAGERYGS